MILANVFANLLKVDVTMLMLNMFPNAVLVALSPTRVTVLVYPPFLEEGSLMSEIALLIGTGVFSFTVNIDDVVPVETLSTVPPVPVGPPG